MNISLLLFYPLFTLIVLNLLYVTGFTLWIAVIPLLALIVVLAMLWKNNLPAARNRGLIRISQITLLVVAAVLAWQARNALWDSSQTVNVGHLLPLFVGSLALFVFHLLLWEMRDDGPLPTDQLSGLLAGPSLLSCLSTSLILSAYLLLVLGWLELKVPSMENITVRFLERGIIPPITLMLFWWGLLLLFGKWIMGLYFGQVLNGRMSNMPSAQRLRGVIENLKADPGALDDRLHILWQRSVQSYLMPRYISWAVPVLGFIGTVLGISLASEGIRKIISSQSGLSSLSSDLGQAIAPLGIAFDTTLIALSLSIVLVLVQTLVQKSEEATLTLLEDQLREGMRGSKT